VCFRQLGQWVFAVRTTGSREQDVELADRVIGDSPENVAEVESRAVEFGRANQRVHRRRKFPPLSESSEDQERPRVAPVRRRCC
jgi:hypothetical protein